MSVLHPVDVAEVKPKFDRSCCAETVSDRQRNASALKMFTLAPPLFAGGYKQFKTLLVKRL